MIEESADERAARIAEVDRIVEAELARRNRAAAYEAAGFARETWERM